MKVTDTERYRMIVADFRESLGALSELHADFREWDDFYLAKQWSKERASWRPDPVINYISYIVDQKAPMLTNNRPSGLILPTAPDDEEAAKLFGQLTDVIAERTHLDDKLDDVVRTGLLLGTGFLKVYWDNSIVGGTQAKGNLYKGDIAVDVVDPTNIYPDPQANNVQECRYIVYAVPKTVQWVEQKFNVKVNPEEAFETEIYNRTMPNNAKDRVMFYEYWTKDDKGVNVTYAAGGKILKTIEKVYKHGLYPFIAFIPKKNRKSLWGIGEPKNIINNQKLLNKLAEIPTTNAMLHSNPITLVSERSGINPKTWTNQPGKIHKVRDVNDAIKFVTPESTTNDVYKLMDLMQNYIERIGGVYDSLTGETPSGVTAATAIQLLQEQGSIPIKGISRNLYHTVRQVYEHMIELIKENYQETRIIRITGEDGQNEFITFNGAEYTEIAFDVKVMAGGSTPTSKAYIAQISSDLFDKGILLPSEYVEMQEGIPNKDRIVARLREQEQAPPPTPNGQPQTQGMMEQPMPQQQGIDFNMFMQNAPPELQQEIQLMMEQGMTEDDIMNYLMQPQ